MEMFRKLGDEVILIYNPRLENVEIGQNIKIMDKAVKRGIIVQVIEQSLVDLTGILEDIVRRESIGEQKVTEYTSPEYIKYSLDVKNMKFARAKVRKEVTILDGEEDLLPWSGWIPDRSAEATTIPDEFIVKKLGIGFDYKICAGQTIFTGKDLEISAYELQGINVIVGKKGTGKSHMAKALLLGLIDHGAKCLIFDVNDEYSRLGFTVEGKDSPYKNRILPLNPGVNMQFSLSYAEWSVIEQVFEALKTPDATLMDIKTKWEEFKKQGELTLKNLKNYFDSPNVNVHIRLAASKRLENIELTKLFTDDKEKAVTIEDKLANIPNGGAIVINLKGKDHIARTIIVQTILSKIQNILEREAEKPLFLFCEEAHMYISGLQWDDLVTRIRHLGAWQLYMTNTPTSLHELVIRQTDNLYVFNLTNEWDINHIQPAAKIDPETLKSIAKALPPRRCLTIGETTKDYPFIINTKPLPVATAGKTRLLFQR